MYTILLLNCSTDILSFTEEALENAGENIQILSCNTIEKAKNLLLKHNIHCMIADLHETPEEFISFLQQWQTNVDSCRNAIILIAESKEVILSALPRLHFCESIINKITDENKQIICTFLNRHYILFQQLQHTSKKSRFPEDAICLKTGQGFKNYKPSDILYVEASKHKCIVHTIDQSLELSRPLCKLRECSIFKNFKQSHRSFLINPAHIKQIDTSNSPWTIYFNNSDKHAFVSRGFKKSFEEDILGHSKE